MDSNTIFELLCNNKALSQEQISYIEQLTDSLSMNNLAYMYKNGLHPDGKNITKTVELFEKAIELGNAPAMYNLAVMYEDGTHPDGKNIPKAIELFEKAVELGNERAMNNLAVMYDDGTHPDGKNTQKAVELYNKAVELDNEIAMHNLAVMYEHGTHLDGKNIPKAVELYKRSFDLGNTNAIHGLAFMYDQGLCDDDIYASVYALAVKQGITGIRKPRKRLTRLFGSLEDKCSICWDDLMGTDKEIRVLLCGHIFHDECIIKNKQCAFCRS